MCVVRCTCVRLLPAVAVSARVTSSFCIWSTHSLILQEEQHKQLQVKSQILSALWTLHTTYPAQLRSPRHPSSEQSLSASNKKNQKKKNRQQKVRDRSSEISNSLRHNGRHYNIIPSNAPASEPPHNGSSLKCQTQLWLVRVMWPDGREVAVTRSCIKGGDGGGGGAGLACWCHTSSPPFIRLSGHIKRQHMHPTARV